MDAAIALEGRRGRRALDEGRDNRNRHLQHARDWEAAMGAAAKATDQWNRVMEHRADDEATRRLAEAERAMTAGTMGQLSPTGDPTGGAFNTPYVPGDPEGNQPGQGASSETGKLAAKVREAAYDGASGRVRYRLDRKFDGVVEPYLRKAQQIDFASAKKLELDTRMTDAAQAADGFIALNSGLETAHGVATEATMQGAAGWQTTLDLGEAVGNAAQKQAVAAMLKAGYRPVNNDFDNPQYAGEAQKMYEKMAGDAKTELSVRLAQSHAQAMVAEDDDTFAAERKGICEFIADGLQEAGSTEAAEKVRAFAKAGEASRNARFERTCREAEALSDAVAAGDKEAAAKWGELTSALPEHLKLRATDQLDRATALKTESAAALEYGNAMEDARGMSALDYERTRDEWIREGGRLDKLFPDRRTNVRQRAAYDRMYNEIMRPTRTANAAEKEAHDMLVDKLCRKARYGDFDIADASDRDVDSITGAEGERFDRAKFAAMVKDLRDPPDGSPPVITGQEYSRIMKENDKAVELTDEERELARETVRSVFGFNRFDLAGTGDFYTYLERGANGEVRVRKKHANGRIVAHDVEKKTKDSAWGRNYRIQAAAAAKVCNLVERYILLKKQGHLNGEDMADWVKTRFVDSVEGQNKSDAEIMAIYEQVEAELDQAYAGDAQLEYDSGRKNGKKNEDR